MFAALVPGPGPIHGPDGSEYMAKAGRPPQPGSRGMGERAMKNRTPALGAALLLCITAGLLGCSAMDGLLPEVRVWQVQPN